jgi:hypothetical protein
LTFCAGWKYKGSVLLLCDAARSESEPNGSRATASPLRLAELAAGMAVACLGDAEQAGQIITLLRHQCAQAGSARQLLEMLTSQAGPFDAERPVALLLASSSTHSDAELLRWTTEEGLDASTSDHLQLGSHTAHHAALTPELREGLLAADVAPQRLLPIVMAVVQAQGINELAQGLSAHELIFGLRTEGGKVTWQDDTHVVVYDQDFASCAHASAQARDGTIAAHSSRSHEVSVFVPAATTPAEQLRAQDWQRSFRIERDARRFGCWVFVRASERLVTLVLRSEVARQSRLVRVAGVNRGKMDLSFSPELMALLLQPPRDRNLGTMPLQLSVRED